MASSPILDTPRLRLEPFCEARITQQYLGWLNDPEVMRYSERRHRQHTERSAREYLESFRDTPGYFWAIVAVDPALGHIGNITAHVDVQNKTADVGILIGQRAVWGNGFGAEAWCGVVAFLLGQAGIRKVTGGAVATNLAMLRIMRGAGMQEDGRRLRHYLIDGAEVDVVHMAKFRNEPC